MDNHPRQLLKSIFNLDSPFMRICERIYDFAILNFLFLLTCLPIITIGCAKLALYGVLVDMKDEQHPSPVNRYLRYFTRYWKQGLLLGGVEYLVILICGVDLWLLQSMDTLWSKSLQIMCISLLILVASTFLYAYPIVIKLKGEFSLKKILKHAFIIAGIHFPKTFFLLGVSAGLFLALYLSTWTFLIGISLLLVIGCSGLGYLYMKQIEKVLEKYTMTQFENLN